MNPERIPADVERRVRAAARNRCGYCLSPQHLVMARLEIEHIYPRRGQLCRYDEIIEAVWGSTDDLRP